MSGNERNLAVVLGLLLGTATAQTFDFSSVDRFAGRYVLVKDQTDDLRGAIDRATEDMSFLLRPLARRMLRQKTVLYQSFAMEKSGDVLRTSLAGASALSLPVSGSPISWKAPDGETVRVHLVLGQALLQVFEAKQGRRENRFTLSPDGGLLTMDVNIRSRELPRPVEYRLFYRRVPALPPSTLRTP